MQNACHAFLLIIPSVICILSLRMVERHNIHIIFLGIALNSKLARTVKSRTELLIFPL